MFIFLYSAGNLALHAFGFEKFLLAVLVCGEGKGSKRECLFGMLFDRTGRRLENGEISWKEYWESFVFRKWSVY